MFQLNFFLRGKKTHQKKKNNLVSHLCSKSIGWLILSQINSDIFNVAEAKQGCTVIVKCFWNLYNENNCIHFRHIRQAEKKSYFCKMLENEINIKKNICKSLRSKRRANLSCFYRDVREFMNLSLMMNS